MIAFVQSISKLERKKERKKCVSENESIQSLSMQQPHITFPVYTSIDVIEQLVKLLMLLQHSERKRKKP